eukprot:16197_1
MASEHLLSEKNKTQKRARATTMLVHELPTSTEIYESFVWDPDDELVFESSSESKESSEIDFSFLFEDSSGEDATANVQFDNNDNIDGDGADSSSLSSSSYTTPGWNDTLANDSQIQDNQQIAQQQPQPTTPHQKSEQSQSEPHVQDSFRKPISRTQPKAQSVQYQHHTNLKQNAPKTVDNGSKPVETNIDSDVKQSDINTAKDSHSMHNTDQIQDNKDMSEHNTDLIDKESIQEPVHIETETQTQSDMKQQPHTSPTEDAIIQDETSQQLLSPVDIANQLIEDEQTDDVLEAYKPVVICVTQFKRKKKRKRTGKDTSNRARQGRKLSVKQRDRIIRKYSRAVKGTIPCPKIPDQVIAEPDGSETVIPVRLVHLFVRARSHQKLNNYKNMNYASKSYQLAPDLVLDAWDKEQDVRGDFKIGDRVYAFVKKNLCMQKEYKMALRTNTNELRHAIMLLNFVESKLDESLQNVKKISKFNHDVCVQSIIAEMNKK